MARAELDREGLVAALTHALEARPEIGFALLHGSFLRNEAFRDIDVAIWLDPDRVSRDNRLRYALDLGVQLQLRLGQPVDVQVFNDTPLTFRYHALQGRPLLVRDPEFLADLRARTWDDYIDFQPFARRYLHEALGE